MEIRVCASVFFSSLSSSMSPSSSLKLGHHHHHDHWSFCLQDSSSASSKFFSPPSIRFFPVKQKEKKMEKEKKKTLPAVSPDGPPAQNSYVRSQSFFQWYLTSFNAIAFPWEICMSGHSFPRIDKKTMNLETKKIPLLLSPIISSESNGILA